MKQYPILYTFRDKIVGAGFLADVTVHGRALAAEEAEGEWWLYGVQPGGFAAGGTTLAEAQAEFRKDFTTILYDIAEDARDIRAFDTEVRRFFSEINEPTEREWTAALVWVRAMLREQRTAEAVPGNLAVIPADSPRGVEVRIIETMTPKDNAVDPQMALAA